MQVPWRFHARTPPTTRQVQMCEDQSRMTSNSGWPLSFFTPSLLTRLCLCIIFTVIHRSPSAWYAPVFASIHCTRNRYLRGPESSIILYTQRFKVIRSRRIEQGTWQPSDHHKRTNDILEQPLKLLCCCCLFVFFFWPGGFHTFEKLKTLYSYSLALSTRVSRIPIRK